MRFLHCTKRITLAIAFLLVFGVATSVSLPVTKALADTRPAFEEDLQLPLVANASTTIYLPVVEKNFPWTSPFGAEATQPYLTGSTLLTRATELNIGWTRMGNRISWRELQPNPGDEINWSLLASFEEELGNLRAAGITPVVIIQDSPHWAVIPKVRQDGKPTSCGPIAEAYFDEFADFMRQLVKRYKTPEFNVHTWELGNEIDVDPDLVDVDSIFGCWGDIDDKDYYGGERYGRMLKYITPVIKAEDPTAKVWVGGLLLASPNTTEPTLGKPENFLRGILAAGAAPYFDILPYHAHMKYYNLIIDVDTILSGPWKDWGGGLQGKANFLKAVMAEYNVKKDLVQGEIGIGCDKDDIDHYWCRPAPDDQFYQFQADMLVRLAVRVASNDDIKRISWYQLNGPGWRYQGLLDSSYNRSDSFIAYQNLIQQLDITTFLGPVYYRDGIEAFAFSRGSEQVHVIWSLYDLTLPILVPQTEFITYYERDGTEIVNPPTNGENYEIPVSFSPIYVIRTP